MKYTINVIFELIILGSRQNPELEPGGTGGEGIMKAVRTGARALPDFYLLLSLPELKQYARARKGRADNSQIPGQFRHPKTA